MARCRSGRPCAWVAYAARPRERRPALDACAVRVSCVGWRPLCGMLSAAPQGRRFGLGCTALVAAARRVLAPACGMTCGVQSLLVHWNLRLVHMSFWKFCIESLDKAVCLRHWSWIAAAVRLLGFAVPSNVSVKSRALQHHQHMRRVSAYSGERRTCDRVFCPSQATQFMSTLR